MERIEELSKEKLGIYIKKAKRDMINGSLGMGRYYVARKGDYHRYAHRSKGIDDAVDKLTKENKDLLSAAYEVKPIEFNAIFNDKIIERVRALVDAKRVEHAKEYFNDKPVKEDFNPGGHKGKLHRELGVATDKKIPASKMKAALHSKDREVRDDAIRAKTMKKWHHEEKNVFEEDREERANNQRAAFGFVPSDSEKHDYKVTIKRRVSKDKPKKVNKITNALLKGRH